jgi:putative membrane protein
MRLAAQSGIANWSSSVVLAVVVILPALYAFGPHSGHMFTHIVLMNVVAPFVAGFAVPRLWRGETNDSHFWMAAFSQVALLWAAHIPAVQDWTVNAPASNLLVHGVLFLAALWFWSALLTLGQGRAWHGLLGLALTGKLVCLLAVLLVFAPRALYGDSHSHGAEFPLEYNTLDDQQLAGLMMIVACPASYLTAAILLAVRLVLPRRQQEALADSAA